MLMTFYYLRKFEYYIHIIMLIFITIVNLEINLEIIFNIIQVFRKMNPTCFTLVFAIHECETKIVSDIKLNI